MDPELSTQCCGKHSGDYTRPCNLPPSLPFCLLLRWVEQTSFSSFGKIFFSGMSKDVSLYSSRAENDVSNINKDIYKENGGCRSFLMVKRKTSLGLFKFHVPSSLRGASKFYSNSGDLFLQDSLVIPKGMEKQMRDCLRVTRSNWSRVVWYRLGSFLKNNFLGPDFDHRSPVG